MPLSVVLAVFAVLGDSWLLLIVNFLFEYNLGMWAPTSWQMCLRNLV